MNNTNETGILSSTAVSMHSTAVQNVTSFMTANVSDSNETMTTAASTWTTTINTTTHTCVNGQPWIRDRLGECVETPAQYFAFSVGIAAIGLWMIAHFLLFKARHDDPDSGCSRLGLIVAVALGSVCNLIGATLCDQLETQVLTACYLVFSDVIFLMQWVFWWNRSRKLSAQGLSFYGEKISSDEWKSPDRTREENVMNGGGALVLCLCLPWLFTAFYWPVSLAVTPPWQQSYTGHASVSPGGRKLLVVSESPTDNFGYAMGFAALFFYSLYNMPTIINIAKHTAIFRESLLSYGFVISANVFYFISIVAFDTEPGVLTNALPWLLTSLSFIGLSSGIIFLVLKNRSVGPNSHVVGRRRADGTFLLYPSEESLNSDIERTGTLRFSEDTSKLPSIKEEPHLEHHEEEQTERVEDDFDHDHGFDAETASIHSHASDFIMDDDEDVYVREQETRGQRRRANLDDEGLEWDFDDFRPKYTDSENHDITAEGLSGSPNHHTLGVPHDAGEEYDDWDEEKVLSEIEKELQMGDGDDDDTISMEYDTADDEDQFQQMGSLYTPHSL